MASAAGINDAEIGLAVAGATGNGRQNNNENSYTSDSRLPIISNPTPFPGNALCRMTGYDLDFRDPTEIVIRFPPCD